MELRRAATAVDPVFDEFFCQVVKKVVLRDGKVSDDEARWLRKVLLSESKPTPREVHLLEDIKREAKAVSTEFLDLCKECGATISRGANPT